MEENEKKSWKPPEVLELPDPVAYAFEGYGKLRRSIHGKWLREKEPQTAEESQRLWEDIEIRRFPEPFIPHHPFFHQGYNPATDQMTATMMERESEFIKIQMDQMRRNSLLSFGIPAEMFVGENDTQSILRDLGEKEDGNMEMSLTARKIKSVTINCEDGKTYEGEVKRIVGCPYDVSSQELTVKISRRASGDYGIKNVIFQNPATIVFWTDGTKTIVNCMDNVEIKKKVVDGKEVTIRKPRKAETYSPEVGLAMAIAKKWAGNDGNYNNVFRKFVPFMAEAEKVAKKAARKAKKAQKREE